MKITTIAIALFLSYAGFSQEKFTLDDETKKEVVYKVASIMKEKYLYADIGEKMSTHVKSLYENGTYNDFSEVKPFCSQLTSDLRSIDNDKHLWVFYSPEEAYEVKAYHKLLPDEEIKKINDHFYELDRRENFGYKKVEILDGNVGYLDLEYFTIADSTQEALIGAMQFLSNTDAIIIDLRNNGGGEGSPLLYSYFFSDGEQIDLGCSKCRDSSLNQQSQTLSNIDGKRMPDRGLYILTSARTFSAAEDFAYTMQSLERGIIIGETSKGGAHPVDILIVKEDILTQFPICESYNSITKTNWEKVGVEPDIKATEENALNTAHIHALKKLISNSSDPEYIHDLKSILEELNKK